MNAGLHDSFTRTECDSRRVQREDLSGPVGGHIEDREARHTESLEAFLSTIGSAPLLSPAAEKRLAEKVRAGCARSKDELVRRNLRLVVYAAKRYRGMGVDFEELLQEGTLGLIRAAEKFDPRKGYKFSTYATWWIRQKASRAVFDKARAVRLPVHLHEQLRSFRDGERKLTAEHGREPTNKELAERLEVSEQKVEQLRKDRQPVVSLDAPTSGGEEGRSDDRDAPGLEPFLADLAQGEEPLQSALKSREVALLRQSLSMLDEMERFVLGRRYGLDGEEPTTLKEIAEHLSVHREAVRKYQLKAERKLKAAIGTSA